MDTLSALHHSTAMPIIVLQGVKPYMSLTDMRLARLVCKEWAGELAAAVNTIQLPPELWQISNPNQSHQLRRLVATYWSFKHAVLLTDSHQETQQQAVMAAASTLHSIAALRSVTFRTLRGQISCWNNVLSGIATLAATVTTCNLTDVNLPGPEGLNALTQLTSIRHLCISSRCSSKLQQQHLLAVASMRQLQSLALEFRTMNGSLLQPVTLDCLGELVNLKHLEIWYTGMVELSTGVCFASDELLPKCKALNSLVLRRVPTPSLRGLFRLQQLRQVTLAQLTQLSEQQARSLSLCTLLEQLSLDQVPFELLPQLTTLTALTQMQGSIWNPPGAGGQLLTGSANILALSALTNLRSLNLRGPITICREDIQTLSASLTEISSLSLSITLLDGTQGFAGFKKLEVLRLKPWTGSCSRRVGQAGLGDADEGPLPTGQALEVHEQDLPDGLKELDGQELVFLNQSLLQLSGSGASMGTVLSEAANSGKTLRALRLRYSPDVSCQQPPQLPGSQLLRGLQRLELQHPYVTGTQIAAVLAECCHSLTHLTIHVADNLSQLSRQLTVLPCACTAASSNPRSICSATSSNTPSSSSSAAGLSRKSAFINSFYATAAAAAGAAAAAAAAVRGAPVGFAATAGVATAGATAGALACNNSLCLPRSSSVRAASTSAACSSSHTSMLESLRTSSVGLSLQTMGSFTLQSMGSLTLRSVSSASLASLFGDALGVGGVGGRSSHSGSSGLSSLGWGLNEGQGLAVLATCTRLEELKLTIGDRLLGLKTRTVIAALPRLRKLTLAVATDCPATAARDLGSWICGMKQSESVTLGMEGPGAGALLQALVDRVSEELPACQVSMLKVPPVATC